jgi:hypothetical protein
VYVLAAEELTVIARIWHGYTKPEHADAYEASCLPFLPRFNIGLICEKVTP